MKQRRPLIFALQLATALLTACERNPSDTSSAAADIPAQTAAASTETAAVSATATNDGDTIELDWDALIPSDWRLNELMEEYNADSLSDDDPRAGVLMEKIQKLWKEAPVVHDYDGKLVKLPGFVVPLEMDAKTIQEFLLVPYYGACIHTPPPPANQTVYVITGEAHAYRGQLFDTVWVTGTLSVERLSSGIGEAGYRIEASKVEPYQ